MKRRYYHFFPTCPNRRCHEPHKEGGILEGDNETLQCMTCGTKFRNFLDLSHHEKFLTLPAMVNDEQLKKTRIFWGVEPNTLEHAYLEWVCTRPAGQFLITWPWKDVRFLSIMASEYVLNTNGKIAIVGRTMENGDGFSFPAINTVFKNILFLNESEISKQDSLRDILFKCIDKNIIRKSKKIHIKIRIIGTGEIHESLCDESTLRICKNHLNKELDETWGPGSIYRIITRKEGIDREEILNENAPLDVQITEKYERSGILEYLKNWELEVLSSLKMVHIPSSKITHRSIISHLDAEEDMGNIRIIFFSENIQPDVLFNLLKKSGFNAVIFENVDNFIKDIIYQGEKSYNLINFLKDTKEADIVTLLFSSQRELRHLHSGFMNKVAPISIHTWDTEKRLDILFGSGWFESKYPNPCSSLRKSEPTYRKLPDMIYANVDEIDNLFDEIDPLLKKIKWPDYSLKEKIMQYFRDMRKTPLDLIGDYSKYEVFARGQQREFTFDLVMAHIERIDHGVYTDIMNVQNDFFRECQGKRSYLFNEEIKLARNEIEKFDESSILTFVVHPYDTNGFKKLLMNDGFEEDIRSGKIAVFPWAEELKSRSRLALDSGKKHTVISTESPSINFNIYNSHIDKIIFVGSRKNLDKIREIVEKRITERFTRPVAFLKETDTAPFLLLDIEKKVYDYEVVFEDGIQDSTVISMKEILLKPSPELLTIGDYASIETSSIHLRYLKAGEEVLIAAGRDGKVVCFPLDATLHYKKKQETSIMEISIETDYKLLKDLKDVEILLGKGEIYRPLKVQFAELVIKVCREMPIETNLLRWKSFSELFSDAVAWIMYLIEAKKYLNEQTVDTYKDIDEELSRRIVRSGTSARDPRYIRTWWVKSEGEVNTDTGTIRIPFVEHPRNVDDMKKIFSVISEIMPSMYLSEESAIKSYTAARIVQEIRRNVLSGNPENILPKIKKVYTMLRPLMDELWKRSDKFEVQYFDKIKLNKDTPAFRVMQVSDV